MLTLIGPRAGLLIRELEPGISYIGAGKVFIVNSSRFSQLGPRSAPDSTSDPRMVASKLLDGIFAGENAKDLRSTKLF